MIPCFQSSKWIQNSSSLTLVAQVGFWITGFYTPASFIIWSTTGLNVAGRTKKSCAQAITFMAFCAGYCIGPQMFYADSAPQYRPGLYFCSACFFTAEVLIAIWYFWVQWENRRRDKKADAQGLTLEQRNLEGCLMGLQDMTDREVSVNIQSSKNSQGWLTRILTFAIGIEFKSTNILVSNI